jgi:NAD(P)H-dependent FMN reductase
VTAAIAPITVLGLCGSLRRASFNAALLRAARADAPAGSIVVLHDLAGVPFLNEDLEPDDVGAEVVALRAAVARADALLLACPEYNGGITPVLKNALDWASRALPASVLKGKPVATMGASPGGFGTIMAQEAMRPVLARMGCIQLPDVALRVARAGSLFDGDGELADEATRTRVTALTTALAAWARLLATR